MQNDNEVTITLVAQKLSNSFQIELPWPSSSLSPNSRTHWAQLAKAKKAFRTRCKVLAVGSGLPAVKNAVAGQLGAFVRVSLLFAPPDRRRRDLDNVLASMKSGLDGLADAMGVDDSRWKLAIEMAPEPVKGGAVLVTVEVFA